MKRIAVLLLCAIFFTGCAKEDTEMIAFKDDVNSFCSKIVEIDAAINDINNETGDEQGLADAKKELLSCLDDLKEEFAGFAALDFPEDFDYLEDMSDEASDYMTEAVKYYHTIYGSDDKYNESMEEYAKENYARAYKRIKVIVSLFRGETPDVEGLTVE